jgi:hypothetical protein
LGTDCDCGEGQERRAEHEAFRSHGLSVEKNKQDRTANDGNDGGQHQWEVAHGDSTQPHFLETIKSHAGLLFGLLAAMWAVELPELG